MKPSVFYSRTEKSSDAERLKIFLQKGIAFCENACIMNNKLKTDNL